MEEENEKETEVDEGKPTEANDSGDKPTADDEIKRINADTERINKAIAENQRAKALQQAGGMSEAGQGTPKPKEETDKEYSDRIDQEVRGGKTNGFE